MNRILTLIYGGLCYAIFGLSLVYLIGFTGDFVVPKSINTGVSTNTFVAVLIDVGLILLFGFQHSLMARRSFKRWLQKINPLPDATERSTYVLISSLTLAVVFWLWQPLPGSVWHFEGMGLQIACYSVFALGWIITLLSTFQIDHAELLGLHQVYCYYYEIPPNPPDFRLPILYRIVRHPLMMGLLFAFWATPHMTVGHLIFALGMTVYIRVGVTFEERAMIRQFGEVYQRYQERVPMLLPIPRSVMAHIPLSRLIAGGPSRR